MATFRAACVQLRSSDDTSENVQTASSLIREAAKQGAAFIATPENTTLMAPDGGAKLQKSFTEER
ncbi:MAG TPA: nitrilase-related carbon-nitrogen hydrolase, partial [Rhizomicrobium sp.]|nr:nitrilase-related carbon-nitrogen hydrolase [Rhizomicrobium sp.]